MGDVLSGGSSRPATAEELQSYERMRQSLSQLPVPTLQHRDNPHEYLLSPCSTAPDRTPMISPADDSGGCGTIEPGGSFMSSKTTYAMTVAAGMALAACSSPPTTAAAPAQETPVMSASTQIDPAKRARMNYAPVDWPLRFKTHQFGVRCYDTLACKVLYAKFEHGDDDPAPSSASRGPGYLDNWNGMHGMIRNFPPPAKASWRSKDGVAHEAKIDIGELFDDELILHKVPREEMAELPDGKYKSQPSILLEVNDRTIRIYMRARIPLKNQVEIAGHMRNDRRYDLILVETYTY